MAAALKRKPIMIVAGAVLALILAVGSFLAFHGEPSTANTMAASTSTVASANSGAPESAGADSNARSGPAAGGAVGTVDSVSTSSFTIVTSAGQKVTVDEASST